MEGGAVMTWGELRAGHVVIWPGGDYVDLVLEILPSAHVGHTRMRCVCLITGDVMTFTDKNDSQLTRGSVVMVAGQS